MANENDMVDFLKEPPETVKPDEMIQAIKEAAQPHLDAARDGAKRIYDAAPPAAQQVIDRTIGGDPVIIGLAALLTGFLIGSWWSSRDSDDR